MAPLYYHGRSSSDTCTFPARFQEGIGGAARGVERSETTRAAAGDGPSGATIQDRADSPGATIRYLRSKAPSQDTCPGETAATDAKWGDRAFARQYRDRMGLRWLSFVCVFACTINRAPGMASIKREAHHARRTKMIRRY